MPVKTVFMLETTVKTVFMLETTVKTVFMLETTVKTIHAEAVPTVKTIHARDNSKNCVHYRQKSC